MLRHELLHGRTFHDPLHPQPERVAPPSCPPASSLTSFRTSPRAYPPASTPPRACTDRSPGAPSSTFRCVARSLFALSTCPAATFFAVSASCESSCAPPAPADVAAMSRLAASARLALLQTIHLKAAARSGPISGKRPTFTPCSSPRYSVMAAGLPDDDAVDVDGRNAPIRVDLEEGGALGAGPGQSG